jgi:hypothetical protein
VEIVTTSYHKTVIPIRIKRKPDRRKYRHWWYNQYVGRYFYVQLSWDGRSGEIYFSLCPDLYPVSSRINISDCAVVVGQNVDFPVDLSL